MAGQRSTRHFRLHAACRRCSSRASSAGYRRSRGGSRPSAIRRSPRQNRSAGHAHERLACCKHDWAARPSSIVYEEAVQFHRAITEEIRTATNRRHARSWSRPKAETGRRRSRPTARIGAPQNRSDSARSACRASCDHAFAGISLGVEIRLPGNCQSWAPAVGHFRTLATGTCRAFQIASFAPKAIAGRHLQSHAGGPPSTAVIRQQLAALSPVTQAAPTLRDGVMIADPSRDHEGPLRRG